MNLWSIIPFGLAGLLAYACLATFFAAVRFGAWQLIVMGLGLGLLTGSALLVATNPVVEDADNLELTLLWLGAWLLVGYDRVFGPTMELRGLGFAAILRPFGSSQPTVDPGQQLTDEALLVRCLAYLDESSAPYHPEWLRRELVRDGVAPDHAATLVAQTMEILPQKVEQLHNAQEHLRMVQPARREVAQAALLEAGFTTLITETALYQRFDRSLTRYRQHEHDSVIPVLIGALFLARGALQAVTIWARIAYSALLVVIILFIFLPRMAEPWRRLGCWTSVSLGLLALVSAIVGWWLS